MSVCRFFLQVDSSCSLILCLTILILPPSSVRCSPFVGRGWSGEPRAEEPCWGELRYILRLVASYRIIVMFPRHEGSVSKGEREWEREREYKESRTNDRKELLTHHPLYSPVLVSAHARWNRSLVRDKSKYILEISHTLLFPGSSPRSRSFLLPIRSGEMLHINTHTYTRVYTSLVAVVMEQSFRHSSLPARQRVAVNSAHAAKMHSFRDTRRFFIFLVDSMVRIGGDNRRNANRSSNKYNISKNRDKSFQINK